MSETALNPQKDAPPVVRQNRLLELLRLLLGDPAATIAAVVLVLLVIMALFGPLLAGSLAELPNFRLRNLPPFTFENGLPYVLGTDTLGRPIAVRLIIATQLTLAIAFTAAIVSAFLGTALGIIAGYRGGFVEALIMRTADSVMSFPSLLMAVIVLFVFQPRPEYIVIVLAITRLPVYIRVARAESLEIREGAFVEASRVLGAKGPHIVMRHMLPLVLPTIFTVLTIDFAVVMLAESSLSFLGIGVQPPSVTWGLMVASGRNYLASAWWVSLFPGVMIIVTALSANILSNWLRLALDPRQRWRLRKARKAFAK